jgi:DNA topoisomerase-2
MKKRVYDIAGLYSDRIKVFLNGERIEIKNFKEYVNKYIDTEVLFFYLFLRMKL